MGQAQKKRQQGVRYQDVELELWELDANEDDSYAGGARRNGRGRTGSAGRTAGRNRVQGRSGYADSRDRAKSRSQTAGSRSSYAEVRSRIADSRSGYAEIRNRTTGSRSGYAGNRAAGSRNRGGNVRQLQLYEPGRSQNSSQTGRRSPKRELQIQDIRRYQSTRAGEQTGTGNIYRGSARPVQSIRRRRAKRRKAYIVRTMAVLLAVTCLILIYFMTGHIYRYTHDSSQKGVLRIMSEQTVDMEDKVAPPEIIEDLLEVNDYSRPGTRLKKVKNVFVHYTANPRTSAAQNRSYFANLPLTQERSASAHLIIGYDGELIQCIPFDEQAYAVRTRNDDSISIECCYLSEDGAFTQETYDTLIHTLAWLIDKYDLSAEDILRHYDCGGKKCPLYYVEHEDAWDQLLEDVAAYKDASAQSQSL